MRYDSHAARYRLASACGAVAVAVAVLVPALARAAAPSFGFEQVAAKAQQLASTPFKPPPTVPDWLIKLSYDQWRDIRFRPDQALWRDRGPVQVQFFHPGLLYDRTVAVNVVRGGKVKPLSFSPSQFDYGRNDFASRVPQTLGYAGLRIHAPFKTPKYFDEVIVFLGATYFRGVGRDQVFGLSARGLAIDTALSSGEEFPYFREFWLETPAANEKKVVLYALLDSPSLTGAYRFVVTPGEQTAVETHGRLFLRRQPQKIGLAPLTSMFFHGENTSRLEVEDFRPEVHDSDGVLINLGTGEWLWRPLDNPKKLEVSSFRAPALRGFGLMQRDRDFRSYEDLETRPDLRPSVWIVPHGDWGNGHVELVEIPTKNDANDNIVAYWVPGQQPKVGTPFDFEYTMYWQGEDATRPPHGRVTATRRDDGDRKDTRRFVVDFDGKTLQQTPADHIIRADVTLANGDDSAELVDQQVLKNPVTGGWRLTFQIRPKSDAPIELRVYLDKESETLTETWSYLLVP